MIVAPLAAIDLEALLPFLFLGFWIVSQVIAAIRRGGQMGRPPARPRPPAGPARQPAADGEEARREMARQIEEFLRQASGPERPAGRPQPPRPQQVQQQRPPQLPAPRPTAGQPRPQRGGQPPQRASAGRPAAAPPQSAPAAGRKPEPPVGAAPITTLKPSLADRDAGRDRESVEKHVREAFAKDLPHLAADAAAEPQRPATPSVADSLVRKLRDPATIRELILVREVLERPVDRW